MQLAISSGNVLRVNGDFLQRLGTNPDLLQEVLKEGRELVLNAIEVLYRKNLESEQQRLGLLADIGLARPFLLTQRKICRPSVWIMRLDRRYRAALSPDHQTDGSGVYHSIDYLRAAHRPYWRAAEAAGFTPEARFGSGTDMSGLCLLVRAPDEVTNA